MAPNGRSNMHGDSYISATYDTAGPFGVDLQVISTAQSRFIGGQCASVTFDSQGRIVTYCSGLAETTLKLLDPHTLAELATYRLPQRGVNRTLNLRKIVKDTSGGAYFYLDHLDRAVLGLPDNTIKVIGLGDDQQGPRFALEKEYDLSPVLGPEEAKITAVLPDWQGRYWFVTRSGTIGTVDPATGRIEHIELPGEELQNSFAVAEEAVYVISDHALYALEADPRTGQPRILWREEYDRGTRLKPGMINQGSGTTPTLLGDDYVAIADNADLQTNVLIYRREKAIEGDRMVCRQPVFLPGRSTTENSLIGYRKSVIIENNYGYDMFTTMVLGRTSEPGLVRIDVDEDGQGCSVVWESSEIAQTVVPKLSLGNGLVYAYTKLPRAPFFTDAFYLTTIDFESGETVFKRLAGTGLRYDNNYSPVTLGPDGTAYVGTVNGLLAIRDGSHQPPPTGWSAILQEHSPLVGPALALLSLAVVWALDRQMFGRRRTGDPRTDPPT
jgi:outer membrane protein assembly factor BamB